MGYYGERSNSQNKSTIIWYRRAFSVLALGERYHALPPLLSWRYASSTPTTTPLRLNAPLLSPRGSHGGYGFNRPTLFPKVPRVLNTTPLTYGRASEIVGDLGTRKKHEAQGWLKTSTSTKSLILRFKDLGKCAAHIEMCSTFHQMWCTY